MAIVRCLASRYVLRTSNTLFSSQLASLTQNSRMPCIRNCEIVSYVGARCPMLATLKAESSHVYCSCSSEVPVDPAISANCRARLGAGVVVYRARPEPLCPTHQDIVRASPLPRLMAEKFHYSVFKSRSLSPVLTVPEASGITTGPIGFSP
jgi:hypothetical protein